LAKRRNKKKKAGISRLWVILTVALLFCLFFASLAKFYWFFDLFSHFVVQYILISAVLTVFLIISKRRFWAFIAIVICGTQIYQVFPYFNKQPQEGDRYDQVEILQYNVHRYNTNINEMSKWIISQSEDADIIILLETNDMWQDAIRRIKWGYPYHIVKDMRGWRNMVVFSSLNIDDLEIKQLDDVDAPAIVIRGKTTGYELPFVLYGVHPPPPVYPSSAKENNAILKSVATYMSEETADYKMLVGDFNMTRFSPNFKSMEETSRLRDSNFGIGFNAFSFSWPSFLPDFMRITIDNILVSDNIVVEKKERGEAMGSDHYPIMTTLKLLVPKDIEVNEKLLSP
jgi:endonuclease/exonuclease/phosphatase (EEP) superfamily protein YafD